MSNSSELFQQMRDEYMTKKGARTEREMIDTAHAGWETESDWDSEANSYADTSDLQMQAVARIGLEVQRLENEQSAHEDLQILRAMIIE